MGNKIGLVDYGAGNFTSVSNALEHLELPFAAVREASELDGFSHIILPGVGAFSRLVDQLKEKGFWKPLQEQALAKGKPFLGICVGMQIMADSGEEFVPTAGLGFISGAVEKLPQTDPNLRLPHMGWNEVQFDAGHPIFEGLGTDATFYFLHSYFLKAANASEVIATCSYGTKFPAVVGRGNIVGVQFHPEKSQQSGLRLFQNFFHRYPLVRKE